MKVETIKDANGFSRTRFDAEGKERFDAVFSAVNFYNRKLAALRASYKASLLAGKIAESTSLERELRDLEKSIPGIKSLAICLFRRHDVSFTVNGNGAIEAIRVDYYKATVNSGKLVN